MTMVDKCLRVMVHSGGSKFYEVATFSCKGTNRHVTVRRWGKISSIKHGGEVKVEYHNSFTNALNNSDKILAARKDYIEVETSSSSLGLSSERIGIVDFARRLLIHYKNSIATESVASIVIDALNLSGIETDTPFDAFASDAKTKAKAVKPPEPIRGDSWGTW